MYSNKRKKVFIVGIVGVPAAYGGFETLVDQLLTQWMHRDDLEITVFCSRISTPDGPTSYRGATLRYLPLSSNGFSSIFYDLSGLLIALLGRADSIILLGVSAGLAVPLIRIFGCSNLIVNLDGDEAGRAKWGKLASWLLACSTFVAKRCASTVIVDNEALIGHFGLDGDIKAKVITYGGDHAQYSSSDRISPGIDRITKRSAGYGLTIGRVVPENNVDLILNAVDQLGVPFIFVGNWDASSYGRALKKEYSNHKQIQIVDSVYAACDIYALRNSASYYVHGHSAGGTNPSLVEMMFFSCPILSFDCRWNRETTDNQGLYFSDMSDLKRLIVSVCSEEYIYDGKLKAIAEDRYKWDCISQQYLELIV